MTYAHNDSDVFVLDTPSDYQFEEALAYLNRSESECLHLVEGRTVYKALSVDGETALMAIRMGGVPEHASEAQGPSAGTGGNAGGASAAGGGTESTSSTEGNTESTSSAAGRVTVRFLNGLPDGRFRQDCIAYVRDWLDLDADLGEFYTRSGSDPLLGPVVERYRGLRLIGVPSLFEALCWTVAGQQINLAFAYTLKRRLVETYGTRLRHEGREFMLFPAPERIAALSPEELQELKFTRSKSETLIRIARLISEGELSKERLLGLNDFREAEKRLTAIRGIGPWTANYVMMRCLRNRDAFPLADVGLHNAIRRRLGLPEKPSLPQVEEMGARWAPWRAYATFYLWTSLTES